MRANKARSTKPELILRNYLWSLGFRGYRVNFKELPGRPDICFTKRKVAIFVNGCFWHRCPRCSLKLPKTNTEFWQKKFELNIERDKSKTEALEQLGWRVLTVWECDLRENRTGDIVRFLNEGFRQ